MRHAKIAAINSLESKKYSMNQRNQNLASRIKTRLEKLTSKCKTANHKH